jgi:ABC-type nitrate/sulfonate/bicarbonate transport system ATPase subunit
LAPTSAADGPGPALEFSDIVHEFRGPDGGSPLRVLDGISFRVQRGQFTAIVGPSGCGKSTLLQMAAGTLMPSAGSVRQSGARITGINRTIGFVPQQAQLLPWKSLYDNVELPLLLRRLPAADRKRKVEEILAAVGLSGFERHYPHQLSGGMQKRASIARTLIYEPAVVLMDEPFGALDAQTRMVMQNDLQTLCRHKGVTVVFVTHDLTEAILLADNVVLLSRRPACLKADVPIPLARPRNVFQPFHTTGFSDLYDRIWSVFQAEIAHPAHGPAETA